MQSSRILGIGTDIVQLSRIHKVITRNSWAIHKFTRRILSPSELVEWKQKYIIDTANNHDNNLTTDVNIRYLATRWAAKEAIYKAYYPHRILKWSDVSIYKDKGQPKIRFNMTDQQNIVSYSHLSISHDGDYVVAFVILETNIVY